MKRNILILTGSLICFLFITCLFNFNTESSRAVELSVVAINSFGIIPINPDISNLGTGFAETVINKVSIVEGLRVIERSQLERAKKLIGVGSSDPVDQEIAFKLGEMLDADLVILGSLQMSRDKFRVSTKTLHMDTGAVDTFTSDPVYVEEAIQGNILKNYRQSAKNFYLKKLDVKEKNIFKICNGLNYFSSPEYFMDRQYISVAQEEEVIDLNKALENDLEPFQSILDQVALNIIEAVGVKLDEKKEETVKKDFTDSGSAYSYYTEGRDFYVKYTLEDNDKAIELFEKAVEADPSYALACAALGDAYAQKVGPFKVPDKDLFAKAIEAASKAIELDPELPEGYKALGVAYTYKGIVENDKDALNEALKNYEKALEFNPYYVDAHLNMGRIYLFKGELDKALKCCRRALELDTVYSHAYLYTGLVFMHGKEYSDALKNFEKAIDLENSTNRPESSVVLNSYVSEGMCYTRMGKLDEAIEQYNKALSLDENYPMSHFGLGSVYAAKEEFEKARVELELYIKLAPEGEYVEAARAILEKIKNK